MNNIDSSLENVICDAYVIMRNNWSQYIWMFFNQFMLE